MACSLIACPDVLCPMSCSAGIFLTIWLLCALVKANEQMRKVVALRHDLVPSEVIGWGTLGEMRLGMLVLSLDLHRLGVQWRQLGNQPSPVGSCSICLFVFGG